MASFVKIVCFVVNYAIFHELCDRMRFAVDCAKSHHRVISEGLSIIRGKTLSLFSNPVCRLHQLTEFIVFSGIHSESSQVTQTSLHQWINQKTSKVFVGKCLDFI